MLSKYSIEHGFEYVYIKNDKERVTAICLFKDTKGCTWKVHGKVFKPNGYFYIRTLNDVHTCGVAVCTTSHSRMTSNLISG